MFSPGLIQAGGDRLENLGEDINGQDREKRAVQPDGQPGAEKIVAHDEDQREHARDQKAVIHNHRACAHPFPAGGKAFPVIKQPCRSADWKRFLPNSRNIAYGYMQVNENASEVFRNCVFLKYSPPAFREQTQAPPAPAYLRGRSACQSVSPVSGSVSCPAPASASARGSWYEIWSWVHLGVVKRRTVTWPASQVHSSEEAVVSFSGRP